MQADDFLDGEARERCAGGCSSSSRARSSAAWRRCSRRRRSALDEAGRGAGVPAWSTRSAVSAAAEAAAALRDLDGPEPPRRGRRIGVRFGTESIYLEALLGIEAVRFRALRRGRCATAAIAARSPAVKRLPGRAMPVGTRSCRRRFMRRSAGAPPLDGWALRLDRLEHTAALRGRMRGGRFCRRCRAGGGRRGAMLDELRRLVLALGYRSVIAAPVASSLSRCPQRRTSQSPAAARPDREKAIHFAQAEGAEIRLSVIATGAERHQDPSRPGGCGLPGSSKADRSRRGSGRRRSGRGLIVLPDQESQSPRADRRLCRAAA